jgi:hypothetical protein
MKSRTFATGAAVVSVAALIAALVAVLATSQAGAARRAPNLTYDVIADCSGSATGNLRHRYSARVLRRSLRRMSGDVREYTGCRDAIRAQLRRAKATVVVGVRGRSGGPLRAGRIVLLHRGRTVDALDVRRGRTVTFEVTPGTYAARADARARCTTRLTVRQRRTVRASVICRH